jgi:hypothetical protein
MKIEEKKYTCRRCGRIKKSESDFGGQDGR